MVPFYGFRCPKLDAEIHIFCLSSSLSRSKSVEEGRDWIVWSDDVIRVDLRKGEHGLGFSILDYQVHIWFHEEINTNLS